MSKIAIMQPYFFPYIGYFQLMSTVDKFVLLDDVNFINRGWINRNRILANQKEHLFTLPLKEASQNKFIKDIEILADKKWKDNFLKTLTFSYKKAPFYPEAFIVIQKIINSDEKNLSRYLLNMLSILKEYLQLKTEIIDSSVLHNNGHLKAQEKIIDICLKEKAQNYINLIGGMELYDKEEFMKNNIQLNFIKTRTISYPQFNSEFYPHLSIIDVMMFNSVENIQKMLKEYDLS